MKVGTADIYKEHAEVEKIRDRAHKGWWPDEEVEFYMNQYAKQTTPIKLDQYVVDCERADPNVDQTPQTGEHMNQSEAFRRLAERSLPQTTRDSKTTETPKKYKRTHRESDIVVYGKKDTKELKELKEIDFNEVNCD